MSLLDYFSHGARKKNKCYFAGLVKVAFADGKLDKSELLYLERMAKRMGISEEDFAKILKHPEKFKLEPPLDYNERIEQLYHFTRMIFSDDEVKLNEVKTVRKGNPMARMVKCVKFGKEMEGLDKPPLPGELGQRIYENVSKEAWQMWRNQMLMIINEYRLNLADPKASEFLDKQTEQFFFGEGAQLPPDYVSPKEE